VRIHGVAVVGVLLVGVLLAGCGGSDDATLSKKAFARQADAICLKSHKRAAQELQGTYDLPQFKNPKSEGNLIKGEVALWVPILMRDAESTQKGIRSLEGPSDQKASIHSLLGAYEAWLKKANAIPFRVVVANDIFNHARELAGKYGFAKCELTPFQVIETF
jgi:hypothetical protein